MFLFHRSTQKTSCAWTSCCGVLLYAVVPDIMFCSTGACRKHSVPQLHAVVPDIVFLFHRSTQKTSCALTSWAPTHWPVAPTTGRWWCGTRILSTPHATWLRGRAEDSSHGASPSWYPERSVCRVDKDGTGPDACFETRHWLTLCIPSNFE